MVLKCRDKGAMKPSFEMLRENFYFPLFTKGIGSSSLGQSSDRVELRFVQEVKEVALPIFKRLKVLLKKVMLIDLKAGVMLDFHMQD